MEHGPSYQPEHAAKYPVEYLAGIELFNAREFHAAHDAWEERWLDDADPDEKLLLQALIQVAVVFHYLELGRVGAARTRFESADEKFERLGQSTFMSLDVTAFRSELRMALNWLFQGAAADVRIPDPLDAPRICLG